MLLINNLSKTFASVRALQNVTFSIAPGELCGLLGPNGAGKSTLFKIIMGLLAPDAGTITLAAAPIVFGATAYKRQIGYAPETPALYDYLTGREFLHCDRLIILHRGQVWREMPRRDWQELRQQGSSLEQEIIAMVQT